METPLINKKYLLQKYPGKGGWTFAAIDKITLSEKKPFGYIKVKGTIDGFPIENYHLMPMKTGKLFMPVRSEIRKKIRKESGDFVHIVLFADHTVYQIPEEFLLCLDDDTEAKKIFLKLTRGQQKQYTDWIFSAKGIETKTERIVKALSQIKLGKRFDQK